MQVCVVSEEPFEVHWIGPQSAGLLYECALKWIESVKGTLTTADEMALDGYTINTMSDTICNVYRVAIQTVSGWTGGSTQRKVLVPAITLRMRRPLRDGLTDHIKTVLSAEITRAVEAPIARVASVIETLEQRMQENSRLALRAACEARDDTIREMEHYWESLDNVIMRISNIEKSVGLLDREVSRLSATTDNNAEIITTNQVKLYDEYVGCNGTIITAINELEKGIRGIVNERFTSFMIDVNNLLSMVSVKPAPAKLAVKAEITKQDKMDLAAELKSFDKNTLRKVKRD